MSALSHTERLQLAGLHQHVMDTEPDAMQGGQRLAVFLREVLPDLDDVLIGRICLRLGERLGQFVREELGDHPNAVMVSNLALLAGLDLTSLEWREAPR